MGNCRIEMMALLGREGTPKLIANAVWEPMRDRFRPCFHKPLKSNEIFQ